MAVHGTGTLTPKLLLSYICSDWLSMKLDDSCLWYTSEVSSSALAPPASKLLQSKPKCSPINKIQHHIKCTWCENLVSLKYSEIWLGSMSWKQLNLMIPNFIQFSNKQHSFHDSLFPKCFDHTWVITFYFKVFMLLYKIKILKLSTHYSAPPKHSVCNCMLLLISVTK